jgi:hypothetical protein
MALGKDQQIGISTEGPFRVREHVADDLVARGCWTRAPLASGLE